MSSKSSDGLRIGSSSSKHNSSKKGKKSKSEIKPKQPQRGLGVAQLEKIRLQSEMNEHATLMHSPLHNNLNMEQATVGVGLPPSPSGILSPTLAFCPRFLMSAPGRIERNDLFGHSEYKPVRHMNRNVYLGQTDPTTLMLPRLEHTIEEYSVQKKRRHESLSVGSKSQSSESSSYEEELDLELKLSF